MACALALIHSKLTYVPSVQLLQLGILFLYVGKHNIVYSLCYWMLIYLISCNNPHPTNTPTLSSLFFSSFPSLPFSSLLYSSLVPLTLPLPHALPHPLSQHGKLGTSNMFVCSVPHITANVSITTYFYKASLNKCSIVLTFVIFLFHCSLWSWA